MRNPIDYNVILRRIVMPNTAQGYELGDGLAVSALVNCLDQGIGKGLFPAHQNTDSIHELNILSAKLMRNRSAQGMFNWDNSGRTVKYVRGVGKLGKYAAKRGNVK
jgi:hypothetical protein